LCSQTFADLGTHVKVSPAFIYRGCACVSTWRSCVISRSDMWAARHQYAHLTILCCWVRYCRSYLFHIGNVVIQASRTSTGRIRVRNAGYEPALVPCRLELLNSIPMCTACSSRTMAVARTIVLDRALPAPFSSNTSSYNCDL
jgi:hypothetical protein